MKEAGSAINLVSTSTDDAEKVFQEAIEQVKKNTHLISLTERMTQLLLPRSLLLIPSSFRIHNYACIQSLILSGSCSQGMTGKGWTWIATDGATTSSFVDSPNLQLAMQGMVGTRPKHGEGALYQKLLKTWKEKDADLYPGLIHSPRVLQVSFQYTL